MSGCRWRDRVRRAVRRQRLRSAGDPRIPWNMADAIDLWENSSIAKECFDDDVHHHILTMAKAEWSAFNHAVTDWELRRYWERV